MAPPHARGGAAGWLEMIVVKGVLPGGCCSGVTSKAALQQMAGQAGACCSLSRCVDVALHPPTACRLLAWEVSERLVWRSWGSNS